MLIAPSAIPTLQGKIKVWCKSKVRKTPKKTLRLTLTDSLEAHANHTAYLLSQKFIFKTSRLVNSRNDPLPVLLRYLPILCSSVQECRTDERYLSSRSQPPLLRIMSVAYRNDLSSTESSGLVAVTPFSSWKSLFVWRSLDCAKSIKSSMANPRRVWGIDLGTQPSDGFDSGIVYPICAGPWCAEYDTAVGTGPEIGEKGKRMRTVCTYN